MPTKTHLLGMLWIVIAALPAGAGEEGFVPLFNGRDLSGWEGVTADAASTWKVEDGMIVCTGHPGTWLRSAKQYDDFNLRFEYKLLEGGNSGIYLRVAADGAHRYDDCGVEVQILDDTAERYRNLHPGQYCASVYKIAPATEHVSRPPGEWNTMEINCQGTSYRVTHNGVVVVDVTADDCPELARRLKKGFLGLQNHREEVWFKNLRVGPPQPPADSAASAGQ